MKRKGRTSMNRSHQVLEMKNAGFSINGISKSLKMCTKTVTKILDKSCIIPPDTPPVEPPPEPGNCQLLYTNADIIPDMPLWLSQLDWQYLVKERLKGVPFKTLFDENEDVSVSYWAFWKGLSRTIDLVVKKEPKTTMRLNHKPGEKL